MVGVTWESVAADLRSGRRTTRRSATQLSVLPNGTLIDLYVEIDGSATNPNIFTSFFAVIRSTDNGVTWSAPMKIADNWMSVGTRDPDTGTLVRDSSLVPEIAAGPGGSLLVVWQDSRFNNGARDAIALSRSSDGGATWSAPCGSTAIAAVAAFTPNVHVRSDGMIGVSYYDFRSNTSDRQRCSPTTGWRVRPMASAGRRTRLPGHSILAIAPFTTSPAPGGYFLGDYQALLSVGNVFVPMFVQTNTGNLNNRTDVFVAPAVSAVSSTITATQAAVVVQVAPQVSADMRQRVSDNIVRAMQARVPGWRGMAAPQN